MLKVNHLSAGYPGKAVLHDVSFTLPKGSVTVLLGPNGCGKTTLLKALCGILRAEAGEVLWEEADLLTLQPRFLAQKIAYLAQSRQIPDISVRRLVLHGRFPYLSYPRRYRQEDYASADAAMQAMGITDLADIMLSHLSGGQRQKVYIAMALAQDTPVILLDEPTTYLDIRHQMQMMRQAQALAQQGKTVFMSMHDLPHALQAADQLILMDEGRVVAAGTPEALFSCGCIQQVFRVKLERVQTPSGWRYFCEDVCD